MPTSAGSTPSSTSPCGTGSPRSFPSTPSSTRIARFSRLRKPAVALDREHDLSVRPSELKSLVRVGGPGEGKGRLDHDSQLATVDERGQRFEARGVRLHQETGRSLGLLLG